MVWPMLGDMVAEADNHGQAMHIMPQELGRPQLSMIETCRVELDDHPIILCIKIGSASLNCCEGRKTYLTEVERIVSLRQHLVIEWYHIHKSTARATNQGVGTMGRMT